MGYPPAIAGDYLRCVSEVVIIPDCHSGAQGFESPTHRPIKGTYSNNYEFDSLFIRQNPDEANGGIMFPVDLYEGSIQQV